MSDTTLTPADLIHGGLYRSKETGVIGRLNASERFIFYVNLLPSGEKSIFERDRWEGIPITPEILKDWFNAETLNEDYPSTIHYRIGRVKIYPQREKEVYISGNGFFCEFVHDLQQIFYVENGNPLEGGPK